MSRRIRNILFVLDLTLLGLFSAACIASQFVGYSACVLAGGRGYVLDTVRGEFSMWTAPVVRNAQPPIRQVFYDSVSSQTVEEIFANPRNPIDRAWMLFGFAYARGTELYFAPPVQPGGFAHTLVVPYWFMILALSIWPVRQIVKRLDAERTRRRLEAGLCPTCGYDLGAAGARCPGCGCDSPFFNSSTDDLSDQQTHPPAAPGAPRVRRANLVRAI